MGRIKTTPIKRITTDLHSQHGNEFTNNFEKNKEIVDKVTDINSKKIRNVIAGYITRLVKAKKGD